jgi:ArsR family transcriptional regulator
VDAVVSGGIGGGALRKLHESGIRAFRAVEGTVDENLRLIERQLLPEFDPETTCCGHADGGGCGHH